MKQSKIKQMEFPEIQNSRFAIQTGDQNETMTIFGAGGIGGGGKSVETIPIEDPIWTWLGDGFGAQIGRKTAGLGGDILFNEASLKPKLQCEKDAILPFYCMIYQASWEAVGVGGIN